MLLALGATRLEATREVVQHAARVALTPLLNTMNVVVSFWVAQPGDAWVSCDPARIASLAQQCTASLTSPSLLLPPHAACLPTCPPACFPGCRAL